MDDGDDTVVQIVTNVYGDVCLRKQRRKRQKLLVTEMFYDYAKNTTLHGIPYMARRGVSLIEKIFWMVTFIISLCLCSYLIYQVWIKWTTSPVIVTVSEHLVPVSVVPFPSVTICPQSKCKVSVYDYTKENINRIPLAFLNHKEHYSSVTRLNKFYDISLLCDGNSVTTSRSFSNSSSVQNIMEVSMDYSDVFEDCKWRNRTINCETIFHKVLTQEGVCYNTNSLEPNEIFRSENIQKAYQYLISNKKTKGWTMEHGYSNLMDQESYPRHGMENGGEPDLVVNLKTNISERDYSCNPTVSGFKVYVNHPSDLPQTSLYYYGVLDGEVSSMALSFSILNTSQSLKGYGQEIRQCYFPDERYLKYFKVYTAANCRMECLTNATYEKCKCVGFFMPHGSERLCTLNKRHCMVQAEEQMVYNESMSTKVCNCLPACNWMDYDAEVLKSAYNKQKYYETTGVMYAIRKYGNNISSMKFSRLEMYYKKPRFISMRRSELFGVTDFLANCGGLLGLFLGFSFLSLVEIYYFLTLRLWCTLKNDLDEEKAERANKQEDVKLPQNNKF